MGDSWDFFLIDAEKEENFIVRHMQHMEVCKARINLIFPLFFYIHSISHLHLIAFIFVVIITAISVITIPSIGHLLRARHCAMPSIHFSLILTIAL